MIKKNKGKIFWTIWIMYGFYTLFILESPIDPETDELVWNSGAEIFFNLTPWVIIISLWYNLVTKMGGIRYDSLIYPMYQSIETLAGSKDYERALKLVDGCQVLIEIYLRADIGHLSHLSRLRAECLYNSRSKEEGMTEIEKAIEYAQKGKLPHCVGMALKQKAIFYVDQNMKD